MAASAGGGLEKVKTAFMANTPLLCHIPLILQVGNNAFCFDIVVYTTSTIKDMDIE